jgi:hypothetical protein
MIPPYSNGSVLPKFPPARLLLLWLSLWMLVVPLVHVHPDADHRHGTSDHLHGGTVHTVFSKDLTCEFSGDDQSPPTSQEAHTPFQLTAHPVHWLEHLEVDVVLGSSTEPQSGKGTPLDVAAHFAQPIERPTHQFSRHVEPAPRSIVLFLAATHPSRAPPAA